MFIKIPFESEIEFKTNISEITKMSLEHDFSVNNGVVLGNFYISGEYRVHAISINKEPFNYTLPFTVELRSDIKEDSLEFNIEDFSYDVIGNKKLKVNIEYSLKGEIMEEEKSSEEKREVVEFEKVADEYLQEEIDYIDKFLENEEKSKNESEEEKNEEIPKNDCEVKEEVKKEEKVEERISNEEEKTVMDTIKDSDDTFVTYHVHIVKESESLDSICEKYSIPQSVISEYNDIDNIIVGSKVIIPKLDE